MELIRYEDTKGEFNYIKRLDIQLEEEDFFLHNHNDSYEILIFISGNSEFRVEGSVYDMKPYDIVIVRSSEMHKMWHRQPFEKYERIVISIRDSFFIRNECEDMRSIFTAHDLGVNNLFCAEDVRNNSIPELLMDIEEYIYGGGIRPDTAIRSKIIDLIYKLSRISAGTEAERPHSEHIKSILKYINDNITSNMSLDDIAVRFYMSKYHLCHIFKQHTGLSVTKYINRKRLLLVRELYSDGKSLIDASEEAGFGNYSSFYKMYVKEYSQSPRNMKKR